MRGISRGWTYRPGRRGLTILNVNLSMARENYIPMLYEEIFRGVDIC
jgi:hypothetical protein